LGITPLVEIDVARGPERLRTLSKSDFKLARTCDAKLYFRKNGYPDNRDADPYLVLLRDGGYMVEALAKAHYPDGIQLEYGRNVAEDSARTLERLTAENVTLFEATLLVGRRQARVDVLEKKGNVVRLLEIKSGSFDGVDHLARLASGGAGAFRAKRKPHGVLRDWIDYVEDVTYQMLLLEKLLPGADIKPYLVLVDTSKRAAIDAIPTLFRLERRMGSDGKSRIHTARYIGSRDDLAQLDLVTEVDVSAEVAMIRNEVEAAAAIFEAQLDAPLETFTKDLERGSKCVKCEFRHDVPDTKNGFVDCWGPLALPRPHMLELFAVGNAKAPDRSPLVDWMVRQGKASLFDIPEEGLVNADGNVGPQPTRQRRQIEYTRKGEVFVSPDLRAKIAALEHPLFFIDFETSRLALPYHTGMRPYGLVTFQWSCHATGQRGAAPVHSEWLNTVDVWPNQSFAESLRAAIGDAGPVLTWSHYEASVLKEIVRDLAAFGKHVPELVAWMTDVFEHRIVDLHDWAKYDYWHSGMKGRTSIKVVLDALWKTDAPMREQFEEWTKSTADPARDPYASLPPVEINGVSQDVHEGTGAMRAYQEMMYGVDSNDALAKEGWATLLKQYCKLDTLSMVLIFEHWRRLTQQ
jgi:hypothetical protein